MTIDPRNDPAERLRALAAAAEPTVRARPDLAAAVLDRTRRRPGRTRRLLLGAGAGLVLLGGSAAFTLLGHSDYFTVKQPSGGMTPTIWIDERVVFDRTLSPARGDVVYAHIVWAGDAVWEADEYDVIQRVVAVGGDTIGCPAGPAGRCTAIVVNGAPVAEPHLGATMAPFPTSTVPSGTVFLLGDDREVARDSRHVGPVALDSVNGVAVRIQDRSGQARPVPGAPAHAGPGDRDNIDPAGPVPPANDSPVD